MLIHGYSKYSAHVKPHNESEIYKDYTPDKENFRALTVLRSFEILQHALSEFTLPKHPEKYDIIKKEFLTPDAYTVKLKDLPVTTVSVYFDEIYQPSDNDVEEGGWALLDDSTAIENDWQNVGSDSEWHMM